MPVARWWTSRKAPRSSSECQAVPPSSYKIYCSTGPEGEPSKIYVWTPALVERVSNLSSAICLVDSSIYSSILGVTPSVRPSFLTVTTQGGAAGNGWAAGVAGPRPSQILRLISRRFPSCEWRTEAARRWRAFCGLLNGGRRAAQVRRTGSEERSWPS